MKLSLEIHQTQKQSQKLVLTPKMKESLEILQMPLPALKEHIQKEITENPVLECEPSCTEYDEEYSEQLNIVNDINDFDKGSTDRPKSDYGADGFDPFYAVSEKPTLYDFLLGQLSETDVSPALLKICRYIIGNIDERGYLCISAEEIACDLKTDISLVNEAIKTVRQFDPAGVCALSLNDCLKLQLKRRSVSDRHIFEIIDNYLELLSENKIKTIAQKLGITPEKAQSYCNIIKKLNPIPSSGYNTGSDDIFIIPEAEIFKDCDGILKVKFNKDYIPKVFINDFYLQLAKHPTDKETGAYLKNKIKKASSLILEISGRERTIVRILETISELQQPYFENGPDYLKPMTMKDIADKLGVNESTISRAVQDKYILCENGMVSIRSLFTSGFGNAAFSAVKIKNKVREIFESEDKLRPFSDQAVALMLNKTEKIEISRRTVAKYRQVLMIPPASKRKLYSESRISSEAVCR